MKKIALTLLSLFLLTNLTAQNWDGYSSVNQRQMEYLDRGLAAVKVSSGVYLSWRFLGTDSKQVTFNLYRDGVKLNEQPITGATNYTDTSGTLTSSYQVGTIDPLTQKEILSQAVLPWSSNSKTIQLRRPETTSTASYTPNDCSAGDLDGDGEYEIIVKWEPSNAQDNSNSGKTDKVYLDAYKLDGTFLWRIDLGVNIRAGAHYTQFMVYDLDGDGIAEIACKTAPGTKDGTGNYITTGPAANATHTTDYRNSSGYILSGPEYLTVFDGSTGKEINTVNYNPLRGTVSSWGDSYGNRLDRYLACIAYLDGVKPSLVMCRGYYTRSALVAYDLVDGKLVQRWYHNSATSGQGAYGQGNHNLSVADVDGDGCDEIIYGSAVIDHDGKLKCRVGKGHGDAIHVSDMDPDRPGYEVWQVAESKSSGCNNHYLYDPNTGEVIWKSEGYDADNGRGMAGDIDSSNRGFEMWSSAETGIYSNKGTQLSSNKPSINFRIYWDGDLQDELMNGSYNATTGFSATGITKWNSSTKKEENLVSFSGVSSCNSTKATPCLSADILGDWREEVILYETADPSKIRIYTTTTPTQHRLYTLMHDPVYRLAIAWQNVAYNQPPHLGIYIGDGLDNIPYPKMYTPQRTDKLLAIIDEAKKLLDISEEGEAWLQFPADAFPALNEAILKAETFVETITPEVEQTDVVVAVYELQEAIQAFNARQITAMTNLDPNKFYTIYTYGTGGRNESVATGSMTKKYLYALPGASLTIKEGSSDDDDSKTPDTIRDEQAAQWQIVNSDNAGYAYVKNRATGEYLDLDLLSSKPVDQYFYYRASDNGKASFSIQLSDKPRLTLYLRESGLYVSSYQDNLPWRWVVTEVDGATVGISSPEEAEKVVKSKEYVDLLGRKVDKGTPGVLIEVITYEDGSVDARKILNKN